VSAERKTGSRSYIFILYVDNGVYWYEFARVTYDVKTTVEKIVKAGLPVELAVVLALGQTFDMGEGKNTKTDEKKHEKKDEPLFNI